MFTYNASVVAPRVTPKTPLAPFQGPACPVAYFNGDRGEIVGPSKGRFADFYDYRLLEGHRKGDVVCIAQENAMWGEGR